MTRSRITMAAIAALAFTWAAGAALAGDAPGGPFYVAEVGDAIHVLRDINGDGDALDVGERVPWAGGLGAVYGAATDGRHLYVTDAASLVVRRLRDLNGDGDAFDTGETTVWADGFATDWLGGIAAGPAGTVYVSGAGSVWRLSDTNGDGDALDVGERMLYASGFGDSLALVVQRDGSLLLGDMTRVHRLADLNGDGDALDVGESLPYTPAAGTPGRQSVSFCYGLLHGETGGVFASASNDNIVYRVGDLNGDGDAMDLIEVLSYADTVYGNLSMPVGMAPYGGGGFLLAEYGNGRVSLVRDANGDGDALDLGEVLRFADCPSAGFLVNLPDPGTLGYNDVTLVEGNENWNVTWDTPFISYGDGAELGVERLRAAFGEGATRVTTGAGGYNNEAGDLTLAAPLDYAGAGLAVLELRAVGNVALLEPISAADPYADRLDVALVADAEGNGVGHVSVQAPVIMYSGAFVAAGADVWLNSGGSVWATNATITSPGSVYVGDVLSAVHTEIYATATHVLPGGEVQCAGGTVGGELTVDAGGRVACYGGTFEVVSGMPWTLEGELRIQDAALAGSPVAMTGFNSTLHGQGSAVVSTDVACFNSPTIDCPDAADSLALDGILRVMASATLTKTGDGVLRIQGPQDHDPGSLLAVFGGTVEMNTDASGTGLIADADLSVLVADATLNFGCDQHLDTLTIEDGGLVRLTGANVVVVKNLVMNGIPLGPLTLTPEPATLALLVAGGLGLLLRRRRR